MRVVAVLALGPFLSSSLALAQQALVIKPLAEKKVTALPAGELFWRIDAGFNFAPTGVPRRRPLRCRSRCDSWP